MRGEVRGAMGGEEGWIERERERERERRYAMRITRFARGLLGGGGPGKAGGWGESSRWARREHACCACTVSIKCGNTMC
eukprot:365865-Chlamydomonas_euryale.AAC.4